MAGCRNLFLRYYNRSADRAVRAFRKTRFGTGRRYRRVCHDRMAVKKDFDHNIIVRHYERTIIRIPTNLIKLDESKRVFSGLLIKLNAAEMISITR